MKRKLFFFLFVSMSLLQCTTQKPLIVLLENTSDYNKSVKLDVVLDDSIILSKPVLYSNVSPSYNMTKFNLNNKFYKVKVIANDSIVKFDSFFLNKKTFLYVTYDSYFDSVFSKRVKENLTIYTTTLEKEHQ